MVIGDGGAQPTAGSERPRMLLYSHDGFGLGHVQRNFNIACALEQAVEGTTALLVGGSPHGFDCRLPPGVDWIKLPSVVKHGAGDWRARTLRLGQSQLGRLRAASIAAAVEQFQPHLIVIDHLPTGVWGELLPTLAQCRRQPRPPAVVLGLRDILDRPEATRAQWLQGGAYPAIETLYDRVLVYGDPAIFATAEAYGLAHCVPDKLVYCGYVGPAASPAAGRTAQRRMRAELALRPHEKLVIASGGGGADAYPLLAACAGAVQRLARQLPLRCILLSGPLMPECQRRRLRRQVAGLPLEVWWQVDNLAGLLGAADLVVAMAGYNTLVEALLARRPLVVVPRSGPSAEQSLRAQAFARRGLLDVVSPEQLSPVHLAAAIERGLGAPAALPPRMEVPRLSGMRRVVEELAALLEERVPGGIRRRRTAAARRPDRDRDRSQAQGEKPRLA
jgi:predicted glycosyltransferase